MDSVDGELLRKERMAQAEAMLNKKLKCRPNRDDLEKQNILKHSYSPYVNTDFAMRRESLERQLMHNRLNKQLELRPGTLELINRGYLTVDNHVDSLVRQGMIPFQTVEEVSEESAENVDESYSLSDYLSSEPDLDADNCIASTESATIPTSFSETSSSIAAEKSSFSFFKVSSEQPPSTPQTGRSRQSSINGGNCPPTVAKLSQVTRFGPLTFHSFNPRGSSTSHKQQVREQQQKDLLNLERNASLKHNLLDELRHATNSSSGDTQQVTFHCSPPSVSVPPVSAAASSSANKKMLPVMFIKLDSYNVPTLLSFCRHLGIRPTTRRKQNLVNQLAPHTDRLRQLLSNNPTVFSTVKSNSDETSVIPPSLSTSSPHLVPPEPSVPHRIEHSTTLPLSNGIAAPHSVQGHFRHSISTPQFFKQLDVNGSVCRTISFTDSSRPPECHSALLRKPPFISQQNSPNIHSIPSLFSPPPTSSTISSTSMNNPSHISAVPPPSYDRNLPIQSHCFPSQVSPIASSMFPLQPHSCNHVMHQQHSNHNNNNTLFSAEHSRLDEVLQSISEFTRVRNQLQAQKRHSSSSDLGYDGDLQQRLQQVESQLQHFMQEAAQMMKNMQLQSSESQSQLSTSAAVNEPLENDMNADNSADLLNNLLLDPIFNENYFPVTTANVAYQEATAINDGNNLYSFAPIHSSSQPSSVFINSTSYPVLLKMDNAPYECDKFSTPNVSLRQINGKMLDCNAPDIEVPESEDLLPSYFLPSPMQTNHLVEDSHANGSLSSSNFGGALLPLDIDLDAYDASWDDLMLTEPFSASIR